MLSVPTLWIVFVVNYVSLGIVWAYVSRSYPNFQAARFWSAAAFLAAAAAAVSVLRNFMNPLPPLLISAVLLIVSCGFITMGVERFYSRVVSWRSVVALTLTTAAGLCWFIWQQDAPLRVLTFSIGLSISIAMTVRLVLARPVRDRNPGAQMAGFVGLILIVVTALRAATVVLGVGGSVDVVHFTPLHAVLVLVLVFLSMAWNFGFLLMAIDRLRAEVAELALVDDLTGVANRRQFLARLSEESARSDRTLEPFVLLMIDLDRFKAINDDYGHAAGDACLRLFACTVQGRLRTGDLLARLGGDEFCAVLPSTTLREGEIVARHLIEAARASSMYWNGKPLSTSASIGVAQWRPEMGSVSERLVVAADQALYVAKHDGRDRYALFQEPQPELQAQLLKTA
jgi:diguanylate cyclase (GGDEF)-like protein